jgi:hypothetical protein
VTFSKYLNLSEPQDFYLQNKDTKNIDLIGLLEESNEMTHEKGLSTARVRIM